MDRRAMLGLMVGAGAGLISGGAADSPDKSRRPLPGATPQALPRWRGFNLLEMFMVDSAKRFRAEDFDLIAELGFDFVRLPLDYRCWTDPKDWRGLREDRLAWIDEAVKLGRERSIHVQINFHRAPGYTVASPAEAKSVWTDPEALEVCSLHWRRVAERCRGIPSSEVSFNPFNEPARVEPEAHKRVIAHLAREIHAVDPGRLLVCDGRDWGTKPPTELIGLGVAAATRGYAPFHLTHYQANWVEGSDRWGKPTYPLREGNTTWDRSNLESETIRPWKAIQDRGVGVMVGEFGSHNRTPHTVVIPWMRDCLDAWKGAGWGWALWNFRGSFGVLDSDRPDLTYESWRGHKLDRAMLELLRAS